MRSIQPKIAHDTFEIEYQVTRGLILDSKMSLLDIRNDQLESILWTLEKFERGMFDLHEID